MGVWGCECVGVARVCVIVPWCSLLCFGVLFCVLVFSFVFWCSLLWFGVLFCVLVFSFVFWCSPLCFGVLFDVLVFSFVFWFARNFPHAKQEKVRKKRNLGFKW